MSTPAAEEAPPPSRLLLELGPLLAFFAANALFGIFAATAVFMIGVGIALFVSWHRERRVPPMTVFSALAVGLFGGMTLWLRDETFLKVKVTLLNGLLGGILLAGWLLRRPFLKPLLGQAFQLTERGWQLLTLRYAAFFLTLALLNEIVWRNVSTDTWVSFKVFGLLGLTLAFTATQMPFLQRHQSGS